MKNCCKNTTIFEIKKYLIIIALLSTGSCGIFDKKENKDEILKEERFEPNVFKRSENAVGKGGSVIFGGGKRASEFGADSVIWQASLKAMEDIPLSQVNYTGGVIISDWYSSGNSNESIKISIFIKSARLETTSLEVKSFKKNCGDNANCKTIPLQDSFNNSIKDKILASARTISIEKKKNN
jgi:hypothetical protein